MPFLRLFFLLSIITAFSVSATTQSFQNKSISNEQVQRSNKRLSEQRRALEVLNHLLDEANGFEKTFLKSVNVIYIKYRVADLLWHYDQPKARRLFIEAFNEADKKTSNGSNELSLRLRSEILEFLLPHDVALAEELATSVVNIIYKNDSDGSASLRMDGLSQQATLTLRVATEVMPAAPQQAARLIKSSFNGWISGQHVVALQKLRRQSPSLADELFLHAITIVQHKPTHISNKIGILAPYLFTEMGGEKPNPDNQPSSALVEVFLNFVYDSFVPQSIETQVNENNEFSSSSFDYLTMQRLIPYFEKHQPKKAAAFRAQVENVVAKVKQSGRKDGFDSERDAYIEAARQNVPDLLEKAEKADDPTKREHLYGQAIWALMLQGKYEQAVSLFEKSGNKISAQEQTAKTLYGMAAGAAYEQGNLDQAYDFAKHLPDAEGRLRLIIGIAQKMVAQGKTLQAKRLLQEIKQDLKFVDNKWATPGFSVAIANMEARLTPALGFASMQAAIKEVNQSEDKGNGYGMGPDGIRLRMNSNDLSEGLSLLAQTDFDRALSLASQIQEKEASAFAKLAVCKGVMRNAGSKASR